MSQLTSPRVRDGAVELAEWERELDTPSGQNPQDEDDWQFLTHDDVRDFQKLFDFFVRQDPEADQRREDNERRALHMTMSERKEEDIRLDLVPGLDSQRFGEDGMDPALLSHSVHASSSSSARHRGGQGKGGKGEEGGAAGAAATEQAVGSKRMFTVRGLDKMLQSMGMFVPLRELQTMVNQRRQQIEGEAAEDLPPYGAADAEGLTYEDLLMFYAQNSKGLSTDREVKEAFRFLDDDLDGFVENAKLVPVLEHLLTLDTRSVHALLARSRQAPPGAEPLDQWLVHGKTSYAEFVDFLHHA